MALDHSYFHSSGKFFAIQALRIFEIFSALICASVFSHLELLVVLGVLRNLILSSAHHSAREIILTHGKFQLAANPIFHNTIHNKSKEKNQILPKFFITTINSQINNQQTYYKFFINKYK